MKLYSIKEIIKDPPLGLYVYIQCFCYLIVPSGYTIMNEQKMRTLPFIFLSDNNDIDIEGLNEEEKLALSKQSDIIIDRSAGGIVEKLFKKLHINISKVRLLAKVEKLSLDIILNNIVILELLDEKDNVVNSVKLHESSIPKELRGKI